MAHDNFNYQNDEILLEHFHPFYIDYDYKIDDLTDRDKIIIRVEFSNHCYTRSPKKGDEPELLMYDFRGNERTFCINRYNDSLNIRQHVIEMIRMKVRHTHENNYFHLPNGCEMYFQVLKARSDNFDIIVRVQSMYRRTNGSNPPKAGMINFHSILRQTYQGRRIGRS